MLRMIVCKLQNMQTKPCDDILAASWTWERRNCCEHLRLLPSAILSIYLFI